MKAGLRVLLLAVPLLLALGLALLLVMGMPALGATSAGAPYTFTTAQCVAGKAFGAAGQTCAVFPAAGVSLVAGTGASVWVTALAGGVPTAPGAGKASSVRLSFAVGCLKPASDAGVAASYAGATLPLCSANGAAPTSAGWSAAVDLPFKAGAASASMRAPTFSYADVGQLTLMLRDATGALAVSAPFVVKPARLALTTITRNADGAAMVAVASGADSGFVRVGERFTISAAALTSAGAVAPNFGSEGSRLQLDVQLPLDAATRAAMRKLPSLGATFSRVSGGVFSGNDFAADDAGIVAVTPQLAGGDYLGAGAVPTSARNIGRFYPDHFDTAVSGALACLAHMQCPAAVTTAAYGGQPFAVTVKAMAAGGAELRNYTGVLARAITLSAWSGAGASGAPAANPGGGSLAVTSIAAGGLSTSTSYQLARSYDNAAPRANDASLPTAIWLRASASENLATSNVIVTSARPLAAASAEGAVVVVAGRLALGNPYGSELLRLPVRLEAQYWTAGRRWETSSTDNASSVLPATIRFANCLKNLGPPCKTALLAPVSNAAVPLVAGVATFWLKAPGAGNSGSAELTMDGPVWLPGTSGRAVFGVFNSPLLYLREMY